MPKKDIGTSIIFFYYFNQFFLFNHYIFNFNINKLTVGQHINSFFHWNPLLQIDQTNDRTISTFAFKQNISLTVRRSQEADMTMFRTIACLSESREKVQFIISSHLYNIDNHVISVSIKWIEQFTTFNVLYPHPEGSSFTSLELNFNFKSEIIFSDNIIIWFPFETNRDPLKSTMNLQ